MLVFRKARIENNAEETVFLFGEDFDFRERGPCPGGGIDAIDRALNFDEINRSIGSEIEAHGSSETFRDGFGLKAEGIHSVNKAGEGKGEDELEK